MPIGDKRNRSGWEDTVSRSFAYHYPCMVTKAIVHLSELPIMLQGVSIPFPTLQHFSGMLQAFGLNIRFATK